MLLPDDMFLGYLIGENRKKSNFSKIVFLYFEILTRMEIKDKLNQF
jgi:hypothetical protein